MISWVCIEVKPNWRSYVQAHDVDASFGSPFDTREDQKLVWRRDVNCQKLWAWGCGTLLAKAHQHS